MCAQSAQHPSDAAVGARASTPDAVVKEVQPLGATVAIPRPAHGVAPAVEPVTHIAETCCEPVTRTLCGREINEQDIEWTSADAALCIVCVELEDATSTCPRCGSPI